MTLFQAFRRKTNTQINLLIKQQKKLEVERQLKVKEDKEQQHQKLTI